MNMQNTHGAGRIEHVLRKNLGQPNSAVAKAAGWDGSSVSRFLSGQQGVPISKIDAIVAAAGYVMVGRKFFDAFITFGEVGMNCRCAREGGGECGPADRANCAQ
ncbi:helix-turn-helix transcriptional regulator [Comamonas sp.]|uniref:helix-turn-helix domain-containing protein n=1 Tax=Comamonas sp. TaxID=34028 RepID=UPI0012D14B4C|nr:helix-turn-helix transcriptional regulator [Comamonas sp.]MPT12420.1 XRE family transcriptional regulator [Comamonas sp.]